MFQKQNDISKITTVLTLSYHLLKSFDIKKYKIRCFDLVKVFETAYQYFDLKI